MPPDLMYCHNTCDLVLSVYVFDNCSMCIVGLTLPPKSWPRARGQALLWAEKVFHWSAKFTLWSGFLSRYWKFTNLHLPPILKQNLWNVQLSLKIGQWDFSRNIPEYIYIEDDDKYVIKERRGWLMKWTRWLNSFTLSILTWNMVTLDIFTLNIFTLWLVINIIKERGGGWLSGP